MGGGDVASPESLKTHSRMTDRHIKTDRVELSLQCIVNTDGCWAGRAVPRNSVCVCVCKQECSVTPSPPPFLPPSLSSVTLLLFLVVSRDRPDETSKPPPIPMRCVSPERKTEKRVGREEAPPRREKEPRSAITTRAGSPPRKPPVQADSRGGPSGGIPAASRKGAGELYSVVRRVGAPALLGRAFHASDIELNGRIMEKKKKNHHPLRLRHMSGAMSL